MAKCPNCGGQTTVFDRDVLSGLCHHCRLRVELLQFRDVLKRTLDRREGEALPFPDARSIPERILVLQNDLDLIEEHLKANTGPAKQVSAWITRHLDRSSNALARLLVRQISDRTFFRVGGLVVSLIIGLVVAIIISASGATAVGAALFGASAGLFAFGIAFAAFAAPESGASVAAEILRGELATALRALTEDEGVKATDELSTGRDGS